MKSEWLCGHKVDWAITSVHACIKPMSPKAVVQAQQHEQPIGQENLPSIPYSQREQPINPICGYSNPFRPGISSLLEEFDEIFYTIKPWGYCGGAGGTCLTYLMVKGGRPRDWFPAATLYQPTVYVTERSPTRTFPDRLSMYCKRETAPPDWTFVSVKNILPIAAWTLRLQQRCELSGTCRIPLECCS